MASEVRRIEYSNCSCPVNHSYIMGVCTPNVCQHDGQLALGSKHIECICTAPWDGRYCERLACWRMAEKGKMNGQFQKDGFGF
jgi:hypothetical protein